jgi:cytochrome P450
VVRLVFNFTLCAKRDNRGMPDWVLTRYDDVLAALKEPSFVQTGDSGTVDAAEQQRARADVLAALPASRVEDWQTQITPLALDLLDRLPSDRPVDLVSEFIRPWCNAVAPIVMEKHLKPLSKGLSDTLPSFLGNALLDLLRNPAEFARLRADPDVATRGVEELLRHAGLVHTLVRTATADVDIGGLRIANGDRVMLKLAAANHDPGRFPDADRLDVARKAGGHVALGAGPHSCAGALVVRMAAGVAIGTFTAQFTAAELAGPVEWHEGSTLTWPVSLPAILRRAGYAPDSAR